MRKVAEAFSLTTSTVSQQTAALAREAGEQLIEPEGRRVRLTPAGRRLADHAVIILAAVDAARLDLDPDAEPVGTVRVGGFATGIRVSLLPIVRELATTHPHVEVAINEYEPLEAFELLVDDDLDLAITYDYNLAPASPDPVLESIALWSTPWGLGVPADTATNSIVDLGAFADSTWICNSRNTAGEDAVRTLAAMAGFTPRIVHQIDSLDLVEDLILDGYGVGLLPINRPTRNGITILTLTDPSTILTAYTVTRRGRANWPPLRTILDRLRPQSPTVPQEDWPRPTAHATAQEVNAFPPITRNRAGLPRQARTCPTKFANRR
jgi:DNA-binding transcriptional LysR family regulator